MFLAFELSDIVVVPFGFLLRILYQLVNNYGIALILFTLLVKVIQTGAACHTGERTCFYRELMNLEEK